MKRARFLSLGTALSAALSCSSAHAATCSITNLIGVAFGRYDVFARAPVDSTGSLTLLCTGASASDAIVIELSAGNGASFIPRALSHLGSSLAYNLYLDAARTTIWGNGFGGSARHGPIRVVSGVPWTVPIYGRVPARQNVPAGAYADTLVATILF